MDHEGILIEVDQGRVTRVLTNGVSLPGGAAVTYDGADPRLLPASQPSNDEQIERIIAALREGRINSQRHGMRTACQTASKHYQAISQATGVLASLLADMTQTQEGDPAEQLTRIQEAVNRIHDDVLREVRQQLLVACAAALDLRVSEDEEMRRPPARATRPPPVTPNAPPQADAASDAAQDQDAVQYEPQRRAFPR